MDYKDIFEYKGTPVPKGIRISPSQISKFFDYPKIWYQEEILKQPKEFKGSTSTVLGTTLHYIFEQALLNNEISKTELNEAIRKYRKTLPAENINAEEVIGLYPEMAIPVIQEFIDPLRSSNAKFTIEEPLCYKLDDGIYLAGKTDLIYDNVVSDYKNASTKPSTVDKGIIPFNYKIQLLAYAYIKHKTAIIDPKFIEINYIVRPTKTIPARYFRVRETILEEDWRLIEDTLQLIVDTIKLIQEQPNLAYIVFKSMGLKEETCGKK